MKHLFLSSCLMTCIFTSCNNDDIVTNTMNQQEMPKTILLAGKEVKNVNGTLSFETKEQLNEIADNFISWVSTKSDSGISTINFSQIEELKKSGFISLYDVFINAMNDVDSYYSREGGYEEFKEKYSSLYFPEEGDDISPYLPVKDKFMAMLANIDGEVLVANEKVSLKDISTYQQLKDLGLTEPDNGIALTAERGDVITGINSISKTEVGKNKVWVNTHYKEKDGSIPVAWIEVCFRKKYLLGWSNHNSNTTIKFGTGHGLNNYRGVKHESMSACHGFSSHDYYYSIKNKVGIPETEPVYQEMIIEHGGTGLTLKLTCKQDSYVP